MTVYRGLEVLAGELGIPSQAAFARWIEWRPLTVGKYWTNKGYAPDLKQVEQLADKAKMHPVEIIARLYTIEPDETERIISSVKRGAALNGGVTKDGYITLSPTQMATVKQLLGKGKTQKEIADFFGISESYVSKIAKGERGTRA